MTDKFAAKMVYNIATNNKLNFTLEEIEALRMAVTALKLDEQIRWERDIAIQQLADLGYGLGEKPKTNSSETPNSSDCISRQAAIDAIEYELEMINSALDSITLDFNARGRLQQRRGEVREILNSIQQLPSVQPEVIRCKDCVNYRNYYDTNEQEERYVCELDGFIWKPEGYCSYAERKTADDNDKTN